jgi:uncharacterized 2Fe-2S/4Fe-4S cluster protein (DUF4445 family)
MTPDTATVRFEPGGLTVEVPVGTTVLDAAYRAGIHINATCGGRGTCGKCGVRIVQGSPGPVLPMPRSVAMPKGIFLACLLTVESSITVKPLNIIKSS